jgi:hypothetical protein
MTKQKLPDVDGYDEEFTAIDKGLSSIIATNKGSIVIASSTSKQRNKASSAAQNRQDSNLVKVSSRALTTNCNPAHPRTHNFFKNISEHKQRYLRTESPVMTIRDTKCLIRQDKNLRQDAVFRDQNRGK